MMTIFRKKSFLVLMIIIGAISSVGFSLDDLKPKFTESTQEKLPQEQLQKNQNSTTQPPQKETLNKVVAIVNNEVITEDQLNQQTERAKYLWLAQKQPLPADPEVFRKQVLEQMINQKVQLQLARTTGIRVSEPEITAALQRIAEQNNQTLTDFYKTVEQQGWTIDDFRTEIQNEVAIQKLQNREVASRISISPEEIDEAIRNSKESGSSIETQYRVADILIGLPATPTPEDVTLAKEKAEKVIAELNRGVDFHQVAISESRGTEALQGGDLGWRKLVELPEAFAEKIKTMKKGDVVGPIRTPNGFHVIKLVDQKVGTENPASTANDEFELEGIFVPITSTLDDQEALRLKLQKWKIKIEQGADFKSFAKKTGKNATATKNGTYWGWKQADQLDPAIRNVVRSLKAGEVSNPIITPNGGYIVRVLAKRRSAKSSIEERNEVGELIFQRKLQEDLQTFLSRLRSEAYIKKMD